MSDIASLGIIIGVQGVKDAQQQLDDLTKSGAKAEKQTQKIAPAMEKTSLSAKQLQAATRGLPAQFTDIATALGSGQRPLQVLLQQGGQLKDMFGGVGPALRATGSYALGLVNPLTLAAAAAAALAIAWKQGSDESVAFNKALILTGNYAGLTADAMSDMAAEIDKVAGTQHAAAAALAEVASTGRFTAEQIEMIGLAAEQMRIQTGQSVSDTVKEFIKLKEDPVAAILELNKTYDVLTEATYAQITALQEQGREEEAANLAIRERAKNIAQTTSEIKRSLGALEKAWASLKGFATEAWDAMLGIGRSATTNDKIKQIQERIESFQNPAFGSFASQMTPAARAKTIEHFRTQLKALQDGLSRESEAAAKQGAARQARIEAFSLDQEAKLYASREQKRVLEIASARGRANDAIRKALSVGNKKLAEDIRKDLATIEAGINEKYKDRTKARKPKSETDPADGLIARIRQQIALNKEELASQDRLTVSDRLRISVQQQLMELKGKVTGARKAEIDAMLGELKASDDLLQRQQAEAKLKEELTRLTNQLASAEENRRRANQIDLLGISGIGREEVDVLRRKLDIEREYTEGLRQLRDRGIAEDSESYKRQEEELRASRDRMLAEESSFQTKRVELMADWANGAKAAVADFISQTENVAGQVYDIFSDAFSGLSDVITDFLTTGKSDWKDYFNDLGRQITQFVVNQQLTKWLQSIQSMQSGGGGGDGWVSGLLGALFSSGGGGGWNGSGGPGWADGGYTGPGGRNQIAGVVHKGEYVLNAETTRGLGRGFLDRLNAGGQPAMASSGPRSVNLSQTFVVQGAPDGRTREMMARASGREAARGIARTGR